MNMTLNRLARAAGLAYLVVVLTGPFLLIYLPGKIFVSGDAAATAANLIAHQDLFRLGIVVGLVSEMAFAATAYLLYRLLRPVGEGMALLMLALVLVTVPGALIGIANEAATLALVTRSEVLAVFDGPQRDAIAVLLISADRMGTLVWQVFWGLWLLPLGVLVYRSRFLPRFIGVWLVLNGVTYVALSAIALWWPEQSSQVLALATPALLGEVVLTVWLLKGIADQSAPGMSNPTI